MLIDVMAIKKMPEEMYKFELTKPMDASIDWQREKINFLEPIKIKGTGKITEEGLVLIQGKFKTKIQVQCSRCLKPLGWDLSAKFDGEYIPESNVKDKFQEEEFAGQFYTGEVIDLQGLIRENIAFALPMQFLCRKDCLGLCSHCGINFNEDDCDCEQELIDPRLKVLKTLLKENSSEGRSSDGSTKKKAVKIEKK